MSLEWMKIVQRKQFQIYAIHKLFFHGERIFYFEFRVVLNLICNVILHSLAFCKYNKSEKVGKWQTRIFPQGSEIHAQIYC